MTDTPLANMFRSDWVHEWGVLLLAGLLALPLFTPRVYGADEIKYFATLRSVYFDRDLHYENEYAHFIDRDPVAHAGLRPLRDTLTPTGYRLNDAPIGAAVLWAPFYVIADAAVVVARFSGVPVQRDGYGQPYIWAVCLGSLFRRSKPDGTNSHSGVPTACVTTAQAEHQKETSCAPEQ